MEAWEVFFSFNFFFYQGRFFFIFTALNMIKLSSTSLSYLGKANESHSPSLVPCYSYHATKGNDYLIDCENPNLQSTLTSNSKSEVGIRFPMVTKINGKKIWSRGSCSTKGEENIKVQKWQPLLKKLYEN